MAASKLSLLQLLQILCSKLLVAWLLLVFLLLMSRAGTCGAGHAACEHVEDIFGRQIGAQTVKCKP